MADRSMVLPMEGVETWEGDIAVLILEEDGSMWVMGTNEGGHNSVGINLTQVLDWIACNPDLVKRHG